MCKVMSVHMLGGVPVLSLCTACKATPKGQPAQRSQGKGTSSQKLSRIACATPWVRDHAVPQALIFVPPSPHVSSSVHKWAGRGHASI